MDSTSSTASFVNVSDEKTLSSHRILGVPQNIPKKCCQKVRWSHVCGLNPHVSTDHLPSCVKFSRSYTQALISTSSSLTPSHRPFPFGKTTTEDIIHDERGVRFFFSFIDSSFPFQYKFNTRNQLLPQVSFLLPDNKS